MIPKPPSVRAAGSPYQLLVEVPEGTWFYSMSAPRAFRDNAGKVTLDPSWSRNSTTAGYLGAWFLGDGRSPVPVYEIKQRIASGEYAVEELA